MTTIMIVEDDKTICKGVKKIVKDKDGKIEIFTTGYAKEALEYANKRCIDFFLLDIQLLDYSGLALAKQIRQIAKYRFTPIVFITAVPTKELEAFKKIHCYDYIIKPFFQDDVKQVISTLLDYCNEEKENKVLKMKQRDYIHVISQDEIVFIESKNRKLFVSTINEVMEFSSYSLKEITNKLNDEFQQCHKSYIVNKNYIRKCDRANNQLYLFKSKYTIPIGRKYRNRIMEMLN